MSDKNAIKEIATRMMALREACGYDIDMLCEKLSIDKSEYTNYESGKVDIPVGFLYDFANLFDVELTTILTGNEPKLHSYSLVKDGEGLSIDRNKPYEYQNLAHKFTDKKAEPFMVTLDPKKTEITFSTHSGHELNYIIEGKINTIVDGHSLTLQKGDCLYFDSSKPHGMKALDDKEAKFLAIIIE